MAAPPPTPAGLYESESDVDMSPGLVSTKLDKVIAIYTLIYVLFHLIILTADWTHTAQGVDDDELCNALGSLEIQSAGKSKEPLRGLPVPQVRLLDLFDAVAHKFSCSNTQTSV